MNAAPSDQPAHPQQSPPAILVVTCSSRDVAQSRHNTAIKHAVHDEEENSGRLQAEIQRRQVEEALESDDEESMGLLHSQRDSPIQPFPTSIEAVELKPLSVAAPNISKRCSAQEADAASVAAATTGSMGLCRLPRLGPMGRVAFCVRQSPPMSRGDTVRFLKGFRFGDTYKLKTRNWLIPQFLSGALILTGVVLTLVGIISLQINKYLHACDAEDGIDCKSNKANINNVMMPIGVGSTGGGLTLILISGFVFVHAFCVIYEDADGEEPGIHDGVLHIPTSPRAALLGSSTALSPEDLARCQSYYDNLQSYAANPN